MSKIRSTPTALPKAPPKTEASPPAVSVWRAAQAVLADPGLVDAFREAHDVEHPGNPSSTTKGDDFAAVYDRELHKARYALSPATPLVNALAEIAGSDGVIAGEEWKKLGGRFNPLALQLVEKSKSARPATGAETARLGFGLSSVAKQALTSTTENLAGLSTMPVLSSLVDDLKGSQPLANHRLFAVQHLFSSSFGLFEALEKAGIDPERATVFGKNYSTTPEVEAALSAKGYSVVAHYAEKQVINDGDKNIVGLESPLLSGLRRALNAAATASPPQKLLLLDEGGKLNRMLHDVFPEHAYLCTIVEQTTNGLQNMAGIELKAPAVSVASSALKREVEGPIIGEDVCATTLEQLDKLDPLLAKNKTVGIVGYGAVGSATAEAFAKRGYTVVVTDTDANAEAKARRAVVDASSGGSIMVKPRSEVLGAGIVVGCTGTGACTMEELAHVKHGAVLVNAASGDHEFPVFTTKAAQSQGLSGDRTAMKDWQAQFDGFAAEKAAKANGGSRIGLFTSTLNVRGVTTAVNITTPDVTSKGTTILVPFARGDGTSFDAKYATGGPMANMFFKNGAQTFAMLRGGTPVNMDRDLPPTSIQLTRSMLFAACIQAVGEKSTGWKEFAPSTQQTIESRWRAAS